MLQRLGDFLKGRKEGSWRQVITYVVLGTLSLVFAAWGSYGIVNLNFGASSYAAEANGSKISLEEARNAWLRQQAVWQQRLGGAEIPPELRQQLQDQVLEQLIRRALLTQRTQELGYRVSPAALRDAVQGEPAFQIDGKYSAEAARVALAQAGVSVEAYEQDLRTEVQRLQLEGGIRGSDFVTPAELKRIAELEDQEREVRFVVLPVAQFKDAARVDDAAVQAYYEAHRAQYLSPESDRLQYAELRLDALAAAETVSDADLRAAFDKQKYQLESPEKRRARHILITGKDDAAALAQAQQVLAQVKAGKDFGELARQYSQDPGSAKNGGDLGWAERATFVKPFADTLFAMSVGEVSAPVKTQFGYHIIRLEEIQARKGKSFEEARPELEAKVRRDHATDRFGEIQEQLQTKLSQPGADLTVLAQEYSLKTGEIDSYAKGAGAAPLGAAPALQELLFGDPPLEAGKIGGPVLINNDSLVLVRVLEHRKPQARPLAEVRDGIVATLTNERATQAALKAAEAASARLAGGATFDAALQELKLTAEPAHFIGRNDPSVPAAVREAAFALPEPTGKPQLKALSLPGGGAALIEVTAVRTGAAQAARPDPERMLREVQRLGVLDSQAYLEEVRRTANVRKNPKAFE